MPPTPLTPEQEARVRELVGETIVEIVHHAAHSVAHRIHDAIDRVNQGEPVTPPNARRGAYD